MVFNSFCMQRYKINWCQLITIINDISCFPSKSTCVIHEWSPIPLFILRRNSWGTMTSSNLKPSLNSYSDDTTLLGPHCLTILMHPLVYCENYSSKKYDHFPPMMATSYSWRLELIWNSHPHIGAQTTPKDILNLYVLKTTSFVIWY